MAPRSNIFSKIRPKPNQLRTVAERRFADAECLLETGNQERANGAMYLAGFVIECLLKALLLDRHPNLVQPVNPATLSESDREVHALLYGHELDDMLAFLPELEKKLSGIKTRSGRSVWREFNNICEEWTVYARYSPSLAKLDDARRYVDTVDEVRKWLKQL
jgi:hypothetical protein